MVYLTLLLCFIASLAITPLVKKLAMKIGATDKPNQRKVHSKIMPRLGGLAIFISFLTEKIISGGNLLQLILILIPNTPKISLKFIAD